MNILRLCNEGEFIRATDVYIDFRNGRAARPIGVTMVGIHARSGRDKIDSSNMAHVINSEMQEVRASLEIVVLGCAKFFSRIISILFGHQSKGPFFLSEGKM